MKYIVTATSFTRVGISEYRFNEYVSDELIDTEESPLFSACDSAFEIEDLYEEFWNRLNDGYDNREIVKVLSVVPATDEIIEASKLVS